MQEGDGLPSRGLTGATGDIGATGPTGAALNYRQLTDVCEDGEDDLETDCSCVEVDGYDRISFATPDAKSTIDNFPKLTSHTGVLA